MIAAIIAFFVALAQFKDLIVRGIIIVIGVGLMVVIGALLFGFVEEISGFVGNHSGTVPALPGIELANSIVPLSECINLIVSLLLLRVSLSVLTVGFAIHRFIWRIISDSD